MRILLTATLITAGMIAAGSASAQTITEQTGTAQTIIEQVETAEAVELVTEVEAPAQIERNSDRQSAWYGKPYAIDGRDVVSYRSEAGPVEGSKAITAEYDNTQWRFSSEENRDEFLRDPSKYVPEFGGYCPSTLADGKWKVGSAKHFDIVDDKLYLSYDKKRSEVFRNDSTGYIAAAKIKF